MEAVACEIQRLLHLVYDIDIIEGNSLFKYFHPVKKINENCSSHINDVGWSRKRLNLLVALCFDRQYHMMSTSSNI